MSPTPNETLSATVDSIRHLSLPQARLCLTLLVTSDQVPADAVRIAINVARHAP